MKMIVNSSQLSEYLDKIIGPGSAEILEAIIRITPTGLSCKALDPTSTRFVIATLKRDVFETLEVEEEFVLPVSDLTFLRKVLDRFKGKVKIEVQNNKLLLADEKKTAQIVIPNADFIKNEKTPNIEVGTGFEISSEIFKSAIKDASLLKDTAFELKVEDNILYVSVGEDNFNKLTEKNQVQYQNVHVKFKNGFDSVFNSLSGTINIFIKDEYPLVVDWKNDKIDVRNILAPLLS